LSCGREDEAAVHSAQYTVHGPQWPKVNGVALAGLWMLLFLFAFLAVGEHPLEFLFVRGALFG
jgi:hypothetical protein